MQKGLTPEEKNRFGIEQEDGLTPEQIATNLENQKKIADALSGKKNKETSMSEKEDSILDLDNVLDKAQHVYEIEKEEINAAPDTNEETQTDTLREQLMDAIPDDSNIIPNKKNNKEEISQPTSHVRTFQNDISMLRDSGDTSTTSHMLREARREELENIEDEKATSMTKVLSVLGVFLILVSIGIFIYFNMERKSTTDALSSTSNMIPSLLPASAQIPIDVTDAYHFKIKSTLTEKINEQTEINKLVHFYFGRASNSGGYLLTTHDFFKALNISLPPTLTAMLTDNFMFGTYTVQKPYPFILLPIKSFPQTQKAMLLWESTMLRDLKDIFALPPETVPPEGFDQIFRSSIIKNQHVRLLYTPVIATSETFVTTPDIVIEEAGEDAATPANDEVLETQEFNQEDSTGEEKTENSDSVINENIDGTLDVQDPTEYQAPIDEVIPTGPTDEILIPEITKEPKPIFIQTERSVAGENLVLAYTFINEYTLLITTNPIIIPEIVKRYSNRQIFLR